MSNALVCGLRIVPATSYYSQGIKGRSTSTYVKGGKVHKRNGFGGERVYSPTRLVLDVTVDGQIEEVCVDGLFRSEFERLTEKRVAAICKAVPAVVTLEKRETFKGEVYYVLSDVSFREWLHRVKL